jgi:transcription elongation factor Elf1
MSEQEAKRLRYAGSLGKDRKFYCPFCFQENEVYSAIGHKTNEMILHCCECGNFVTRLKKNYKGDWELDLSVYD